MHLNFDILIPFLHYEKELERELLFRDITVLNKNERYIMVPENTIKPIWCQAHFKSCTSYNFVKKSEALKILKSEPVLGTYLESPYNIKLGHALKEELREFRIKRIKYEPNSSFKFKYFVWTIGPQNELIICRNPVEQFPLGWHEFEEDKQTPPNRAYLKLWEMITLGYIQLKPSDVVIDLGASPGGWSWVLSQLTSKVYAIDRSPLEGQLQHNKKIVFSEGDAFSADPAKFTDCQWLFSDIICTPERLFGLVQNWLGTGAVKNFVCTIKFKGDCDFEMIQKFLEIENSRIIHLYQNKNEVTWIKQGLDNAEHSFLPKIK